MKGFLYGAKSFWWRVVIGALLVIGALIYLYCLVRPASDKGTLVKEIALGAKIALTENQLHGKLEKDKIGAVREVFINRLNRTKDIADREERLRALIRLHEELDI
jgi:hypothetical protein